MSPSISNSSWLNKFTRFIGQAYSLFRNAWSFIRDTYRGIDKSYVLFWENDEPSLYEKITYKNDFKLVKIDGQLKPRKFPISTTIFVSGPQLYQRLFALDDLETDLTDWIINNRHRIWPSGISEDLLDIGYTRLKFDACNYIHICLIRKDVLANVNTYCAEHGLVASGIYPRVTLLWASGLFNAGSQVTGVPLTDISLTRTEISERLLPESDYYKIRCDLNSDKAQDIPAVNIDIDSEAFNNPQKPPKPDNPLNSFEQIKSILFQEINYSDSQTRQFPVRGMKKTFRILATGIMMVLMFWTILNIIFALKESNNAGPLQELELLKANEQYLKNKITVVEKDLQGYTALLSHHSSYGRILADISSVLPESLWLNRVELSDDVQGGINVQIKGYSVEKSEPTQLAANIENIPNANDVELVSLSLVIENVPLEIPAIYQSRLFAFLVKFKVTQ